MAPASMFLLGVFALSCPFIAVGAKKATDDTSNPAYATTPAVTTAGASGKPAKPAGFAHPGVLLNRAQLDDMKKRVAGGVEPQKAAFEKLKDSPLGETVECGSFSKPGSGL